MRQERSRIRFGAEKGLQRARGCNVAGNISIGFNFEANQFHIPAPLLHHAGGLDIARNPRVESSRGFTIMEVALAATVLAFTLMGMIGVVESGAKMLDLSRKQTIAAQILHSEIDQLRLQSWTTITGYTVSNSDSSPFTPGYASSTTLTTANDPTLSRFAANLPNVRVLFHPHQNRDVRPTHRQPEHEPGLAYSRRPI